MAKKIFISYAKKDAREIALALADALTEVDGLDVWIDRSLRAGRSWELQIQQQIDECDVMIVLYSPDINRHKLGQPESYVLTEIAYAKYTIQKPIIPVMAVVTDPPMALTMEHYIDYAVSGNMDELVETLYGELRSTVGFEASEALLDINQILDQSAEDIYNIIGGPFEWCEVPAGEFIYGGEKEHAARRRTLSLPAFAMAKYAITYNQFQVFTEDEKGYPDSRWWEGLVVHSEQPEQQWWRIKHHPRETVS